MGNEKRALADLTPEEQEKILNLVMAGRRSAATLVLYRLLGCSLEDAWVIMNDLSDNTNFEKPSQDLGFTNLENYLKGPSPWKEKKYFILAALLFIGIGGAVVVFKWPRFQTGISSYYWPKTEATIVKLRFFETRRLRHTGSEVTSDYVDYGYEYRVDDVTYSEYVRRQYYPNLGEKAHFLGESIEVVYNPTSHEESVHKRNMYSRVLGVAIGMIIMVPGGIIFGFWAMFTWLNRRLKKIDPLFIGA